MSERITEQIVRDTFLPCKEQGFIAEKETSSFTSRILCGDVLEKLNDLNKQEKFDVIIIDPPYNIGKDFGNNKDLMELESYITWSKEWLDLCFEVLADNGLIYVYGFPEILARIAVRYPIDKQRILVWHYTNKTTPSSTFWQRSYEAILCLWNKDRPSLEIDQIREPYTDSYMKCEGKKRRQTQGRFGNKTTTYKVNKNGALPRDVIKIPALAGGAGYKERYFMCRTCNNNLFSSKKIAEHTNHDIVKHPTQKPMKLTKKLIQSRIKRNNGRVLIPFVGSGSECVVAKELGIAYLGFELNPEYVECAKKWLEICTD